MWDFPYRYQFIIVGVRFKKMASRYPGWPVMGDECPVVGAFPATFGERLFVKTDLSSPFSLRFLKALQKPWL